MVKLWSPKPSDRGSNPLVPAMDEEIFVFGSNLAGRHGKGAAKFALDHYGAIYGRGEGLQGQCYAIPTKDIFLKTLPINKVKIYINKFLIFAKEHSELKFVITRIGCGLAGYCDEQIAPLFKEAPDNCFFDQQWEKYLKEEKLSL